jgi:hypothetical protein
MFHTLYKPKTNLLKKIQLEKTTQKQTPIVYFRKMPKCGYSYCRFVSDNIHGLVEHQNNHQSTHIKPCALSDCLFKATYFSELARHYYYKHNQRSCIYCEKCSRKTFKHKNHASLAKHLRTCPNIKDYFQASICSINLTKT